MFLLISISGSQLWALGRFRRTINRIFCSAIVAIWNIGKEEEGPSVYGTLERPEDGVNIHGLFIDAGRWDMEKNCLVDAIPGMMNPPLPVVWFRPVLELPKPDPRYEAPLYKTSERAGTLSTTGHSTNFVLPVLLPAIYPQPFWIIRATALLTQITD